MCIVYCVEKLLQKPQDPSLVGLLQAIGVTIYCALIGGFFFLMEKVAITPGFFGIFLMLTLFVFSAAVTGLIVFGYPAYLALNRKIKEAISVLAYTLLYALVAILLIGLVIVILPIN